MMWGGTKSCGCWNLESLVNRSLTHGSSMPGSKGHNEYAIWSQMRGRCSNPNNPQYVDYGGRNIKVCSEWESNFEQFYKDMGPRPSNKHSIDRIDNDGDYCPENCRWATQKEQCNNMRRNVRLAHNGETKTEAEWASHFDIKREIIKYARKRGSAIVQELFSTLETTEPHLRKKLFKDQKSGKYIIKP